MSPGRERLWLALVAVVAAAASLARVWPDPTHRLVGYPLGEGTSHVWLQWVYETRPRLDGFTFDGLVLGQPETLAPTDALTHLAVWVLDRGVGRVFAYALVVAAMLAVGAASVGGIARRWGAPLPVALLATATVVFDPALRAYLSAGRYDAVAVTLVAAAAWALVAAVQDGGRWRFVRLALLTGALAWLGPNVAVVAAVVLVPAGGVAWLRGSGRTRVALGAAVVGAVLIATPWIVAFRVEGAKTGTRFADTSVAPPVVAIESAHTVLVSRRFDTQAALADQAGVSSAFVLSETLRGTQRPGPNAPPVCGQALTAQPEGLVLALPWIATVLLAFRRPAAGAAAALGLGVLWGLSTGYGASQSPGVPLPDGRVVIFAAAALVQRFPPLALFRNYGLFAAAAGMAGVAVTSVGARRPVVRGAMLCGLVAECLLRTPLAWPASATDLRAPAGLVDALEGAGMVAVIPHGAFVPQALQLSHGRPSADGWYSPRSCFELPSSTRAFFAALNATRAPAADAVTRLREAGVTDVVLLPRATSAEYADALTRVLDAVFGAHDGDEDWRRWRL